jgi:hypothetical protein
VTGGPAHRAPRRTRTRTWLATGLTGLGSVVAFSALAAAVPAAVSGEGIHGRVVAGPTCPVETLPPDPKCAPTGVAAHVRVYRRSDGHTVAQVRTRGDGRFRVRLRPGRYAVTARPVAGGRLPRCPPGIHATVHPGRYARVAIDCDTGIR